eukprot:2593681-Prymnesium_polylepis.1
MELMADVEDAINWASSETVLPVLQQLLREPFGPTVLASPDGGLRAAHVVGLARQLMPQAWKLHFKGRSAIGDCGVALHVWLYHLGRQGSKLRAPPASLKADGFTRRLLER